MPTRPLTCPACGNEVSEDTRYCSDCGAYQDPVADRIERGRSMRRRWQSVKGIILFYVIILCAFLPLHWVAEEHLVPAETIVYIVITGIVAGYWKITGTRLRGQFLLSEPSGMYALIGLGVLIPLLCLNLGYHHLLHRIFELPLDSYVEPYERAGYGLGMAILFVCLAPAILEEIAFRGLVQERLKSVLSHREALILTAAMFAIIHVSMLSWPMLFVLGLVLGYLRERSGSLLPCMIMHFFHNLVVVLLS